MAKAIPIIGIIGALLATLTATILVDVAPAVVGLIFIALGIYLAISKDWRRLAPGIAAAVFSVAGILGVIGSVGGEDGAVEFPISVAMGTALIVAAGLEIAAASALQTLDLEPKWMSYMWLGLGAVTFLLAFIVAGQLGDQSQPGSIIVGALALGTLGAPIQLLRSAE